MPSNPFFSGRIPPELLDAIEKHRQLTGESKTDLLIKALSQYVGFQLEEKEDLVPPLYEELNLVKEDLSKVFSKLNRLEDFVFSKDKSIAIIDEVKPKSNPDQMEIDFGAGDESANNNVIEKENSIEEKIMTTTEVADLLGINRSTVNSWKKNKHPKLHEGYEIEFDDIRSETRTNYWIVRGSG